MRLWLRFPATPSSDRTRAIRRRSLLLAVIGVAVLPLAWRGPSCGQDFDFHLQNWIELAHAWRHGLLYPWWAASANYGAGEPRFVFYPPLSRIVGALLGCILPWSWTPLAFALLCLLGAGFSLRAMARAWLPEDSATLAACLYVINPYMLFVVYERGAEAELLAAVFVPLVVLFALRPSSPNSSDSPPKSTIVPLALTFGALWLTNAPSGVMGGYMLALLVVVAALRQRSWRLIARSAAAVPLGLALAGFWLIPAIFQQRWVEIARATAPLMRVQDSFLFGFVRLASLPAPVSAQDQFDLAYHNQVLHLVSLVVVALLAATALAAWPSRRPLTRLWLPFVVVAGAVGALQFPWSHPVWQSLPELRYLQFPWRWMLVLGMICATVAGAALGRVAATRRAIAIRAMLVLLLACGLSVWASRALWQPCDEEDNVAAQIATFKSKGFEGTDEYTPAPADNSLIQQGLPPVRILAVPDAEESTEGDNPAWSPDPAAEVPARIALERWQIQTIDVHIDAQRSAWAVFRLMDYPAWQITLNGAALQTRPLRPDGLIVVPLNPGSNRVIIRWRTTADQRIGIALSLAALAVTLALAFAPRRKSRKIPLP
ncbi:MAG: 6-pyruvoyl-tetrahydropterin synthase-related protein [Acidobacteriaceae bacterium]